jgi:hypothetical protein
MNNEPQRPWLGLYRGVRPELKPACETALDMFRKTLERNGNAPVVHYFDGSLSAADWFFLLVCVSFCVIVFGFV